MKRIGKIEQTLQKQLGEIDEKIRETEQDHDRIMAKLDTLVEIKNSLVDKIFVCQNERMKGKRSGGEPK